jgi:hypothetical protein
MDSETLNDIHVPGYARMHEPKSSRASTTTPRTRRRHSTISLYAQQGSIAENIMGGEGYAGVDEKKTL